MLWFSQHEHTLFATGHLLHTDSIIADTRSAALARSKLVDCKTSDRPLVRYQLLDDLNLRLLVIMNITGDRNTGTSSTSTCISDEYKIISIFVLLMLFSNSTVDLIKGTRTQCYLFQAYSPHFLTGLCYNLFWYVQFKILNSLW